MECLWVNVKRAMALSSLISLLFWALPLTAQANSIHALGDTVFFDQNDDGVQSSLEPGVAGVTILLGGSTTGAQVTDANGNYLFTGIPTGVAHTLQVDTSTIPTGFVLGNNTPQLFNITLTDQAPEFLDADFGLIQADPIPEPSTILLFGSGLAGLAAWRYRKSVKS